ncbi:MAG: hypothetical protein GWO24_06455, partial [Akkermansiaceae bacterium]|nr:hypothetical protein [Akkermansiaceae bacterium]
AASIQKTINHLIQLQDLTVARAQQEASMPGKQLTQLDEAIRAFMDELPPDIISQFRKIQRRDLNAFVPVANGVCSACGMSLPVSLANSVKAAETIYACPNCARMLFHPETTVRGERKRTMRGEAPKLGVARFSSQDLMVPKLVSDTRDDAIAELSGKLEAEGFVEKGSKLVEKALLREAIVST